MISKRRNMKPEASPQNGARRYAVFLSYRHADNKEQGRQWATWLHQVLEGYEIPADLVGTKNSKGDLIPASLYPVFRDEEELPADADLTRNIRQALENSALLVVICSPRAVQSRFVAEEIRYFKELGKADRILALMIDGEPNAAEDSAKQAAGFTAEMECLPEPLRYGVAGDDGKIDWNRRTEPIAADARPDGRPEQGWTTGAAYREALRENGKPTEKQVAQRVREYEERLELTKLKVVAGALVVPLGVLTERDKAMQLRRARQRSRTLRRWLAAVALLAVLAIAGGLVASRERNRAEAEAAKNKAALVRTEYLNGVDRVRSGRYAEALAYFADTLRLDPAHRNAASSIFALLTQKTFTNREMLPLTLDRKPIFAAHYSPDGKTLAVAAGDYRHFKIYYKNGHDDSAVFLINPLDGSILQRLPHPDAVLDVSFSPDGKLLATACGDGFVRLFDPQSGREIDYSAQPDRQAYHTGGKTPIRHASFSPDGNSILITAETANDHTANLWKFRVGQSLILDQDQLTTGLCTFSPDGSKVLTGCGSTADRRGFAQLWDSHTGKPLGNRLPHRSWVECTAFSPDGRFFATAASDFAPPHGEIYVWETATQRLLAGPLLHTDRVLEMVFSPDSQSLLSVSGDHTAALWNVRTGKQIGAPMEHRQAVLDGAFSPDGKLIATASNDQTARFWSAETALPVSQPLAHKNSVRVVNFSPDGRHMATGCDDGSLHFWPVPDQLLHGLKLTDAAEITSVAFSADGTKVSTGSLNGIARIWNAQDGQALGEFGPHIGRVDAVAFSPDGTQLATASGIIRETRSEARLWAVATEKPLVEPLLHDLPGDTQHSNDVPIRFEGTLRSVAFSPDGKLMVSASQDRTARVWDTATGHLVYKLENEQTVYWAGFTPDGQWILSASGNADIPPQGETRVWNRWSGQLVHTCPGHRGYIHHLAISADSHRFVSAGWDKIAQVWDVLTGLPIGQPLTLKSHVSCVGLNPDGTLAAAGSFDNSAYFWKPDSSNKPVVDPLQHKGEVHVSTFSPDGQFLLTASTDGTVRTWDVLLGQPISEAISHPSPVRKAVYNADGTRIAVGCVDGSAYVWDLAPTGSEAIPSWLPEFAEDVAALRVASNHLLEEVPIENYFELRKRFTAERPKEAWGRFASWFFSDPETRPASPWCSRPASP